MKTTLLTASCLALGVAVAFAWSARRADIAADAELASVAQQAATTTAAIQRLETQLAATEKETGDLRSTLARTGAAGKAPRTAATPVSLAELEQKIAASRSTAPTPAGQLLGLDVRRADVKAANQQFFVKRGLSPDQIDRFLAIDRRRHEADMDVSALVKQGVVAEDDPVVVKLKADTKSEREAAFRELLGEEGFKELQEHWRLLAATEMMKGFAGMAAIYGGALTRTQLDQLVQIVAEADSTYRAGGSVNFLGVDWDRFDARARPLLNDTQWAILQNLGSGMPWNWAYSRAQHAINKAVLADAGSSRAGGGK
ncbi:MAG: hypothetical protein HZA93_09610 [Verrucomicrobia bacterium]|nr:hypothetical protein [Verrucomicrobiota bacterium]